MQGNVFSFPDWVNDFIPDDGLFARAYEETPDNRRALIKTCVARLYDWYGPRKDFGGEILKQWMSGFESRTQYRAVDFSVVLFDSSLQSPARLLAGLVPALATGVESVLAVRIGGGAPWRKAVLTGLELTGQESVVDMDDLEARRLFNELRESGHTGAVTVLGPKAAAIKTSEVQAASRIAFWRPRFSRFAVVWMDSESSFDLGALAFMHPDMIFSVFGAETDLPADNFSYEGDDFDEYLDAIMDVAYCPVEQAASVRGRAKLTLGPGQEGCWVWPDLHPEHFQFQWTTWNTGA